jgi:hypothetical protein
VLASLESSQFSAWMRGELWGSPLALTVHALGTALLIGFIFIISLRLLGLFDTIAYTSLRRLFPVVWVAFLLQLLSGFALWMVKPTQYSADAAFLLKVGLVIVGFVLTLYLARAMKREAASWEAGTESPPGSGFVGASLLVWCGVVIAARLTAYLGSLNIG